MEKMLTKMVNNVIILPLGLFILLKSDYYISTPSLCVIVLNMGDELVCCTCVCLISLNNMWNGGTVPREYEEIKSVLACS